MNVSKWPLWCVKWDNTTQLIYLKSGLHKYISVNWTLNCLRHHQLQNVVSSSIVSYQFTKLLDKTNIWCDHEHEIMQWRQKMKHSWVVLNVQFHTVSRFLRRSSKPIYWLVQNTQEDFSTNHLTDIEPQPRTTRNLNNHARKTTNVCSSKSCF